MTLKANSSHVHTQDTSSDTWTITHGLSAKPSVAVQVVYESVLQTIIPNSISYPDLNTVVVHFTMPFTGTARLI